MRGRCAPTNLGLLKIGIDIAGYPKHYPTQWLDRIVPLTVGEYPVDIGVYVNLHPEKAWDCLNLPFPYQLPGFERP
jgi:hypothetical protein